MNLPMDMEPTGEAGSYESETGIFTTGDLPEMGYVSHYIQVCLWYVNMVAKPEQSGIMLYEQPNGWRCDVQVNNAGIFTRVGIFENPGADPAHRFIYTKWNQRSIPNQSFPRLSAG